MTDLLERWSGAGRLGATIGGRRRRRQTVMVKVQTRSTLTDYRDAGIRDTVWLMQNRVLAVPDFTPDAQVLAARGEHGAAAESLLHQYLRIHGDTTMAIRAFARRVSSLRAQLEREQRKEVHDKLTAKILDRRSKLPPRWFLAFGLLISGILLGGGRPQHHQRHACRHPLDPADLRRDRGTPGAHQGARPDRLWSRLHRASRYDRSTEAGEWG